MSQAPDPSLNAHVPHPRLRFRGGPPVGYLPIGTLNV